MTFFSDTGIQKSERENGRELRTAFETARNRKLLGRFDKSLTEYSMRKSLLAVNPHARIAWGQIICKQIQEHLCIGDEIDEIEHHVPVHFVTLVDIEFATDVSGEPIDIEKLKGALRSGLRGLSHLGIVEPAYYSNLQVGVRFQGKRCLFWHMHALVWGVSKGKLRKLIKNLEASGRYRAIAERFRGAHSKPIKQGDLAKVAGYMLKSPGNAYRVWRTDMTAPNGDPVVNEDGEVQARFFQRRSRLRKGERISLFLAMKHLRLDRMALAGGEGSALLARAKRFALST
jgi:hypothetical protein